MKLQIVLPLCALVIICYSFFAKDNEILKCYLNLSKIATLSSTSPERLVPTSRKARKFLTEEREVIVSRNDGYEMLYNTKRNYTFVGVKVESSDPDSYGSDTLNVLKNLQFINSHSVNMETKDLITLTYNNHTVYGVSRNSLDTERTLGFFVMFPGKNVIVYFDFYSLKSKVQNFESQDDYRSMRNSFLGEYTSSLNNCLN